MHQAQNILRILTDAPLAGAVNMARDEAILEQVNDGQSPPTLRFYQWYEPTISLGYFQKYEQFQQQDEVIRKMPAVRRLTGGGAILHDSELTYSIVLPLGERADDYCINTEILGIENLYQLIHNSFTDVLTELGINIAYRGGTDRGNSQRGPFFCFARLHRLDLVVGNDKLLGSAQRRITNAVLQHGSLILTRNFNQQPCAESVKAARKPIILSDITTQLANIISRKLGLVSKTGQLSLAEQCKASKLQHKYESDLWNIHRQATTNHNQ